MRKWFPWIVAGCFALWFLSGAQSPKRVDGFDVAAFGRLPVLLNGRIQPFDSVARNTLLSISGRSTVRLAGGHSLSATQWLLETMAHPALADGRKIFRVQHPDLQGLLGTEKQGLHYYSLNDLSNQIDHLETQVLKLEEAESGRGEDADKTRDPFQKDLMHLYESLVLYDRLKHNLGPAGADDFQKELEVFQQTATEAGDAVKKAGETNSPGADKRHLLEGFHRRYARAGELAYVRAVPPLPGAPRNSWTSVGSSLTNSGGLHPAVEFLAAISTAYQQGNPAGFNRAVAGYRVWLRENNLSSEVAKGGEEYFFNQIEPFYKSMVIYIAAVILGCAFWINLSEPVRRTGFALLALAFIIHTVGLGLRMWLEGRPPVTNLYSSAIFIGWGAVALGMILERIFKGGIGLVSSGLIGFVTLIIAHHLALSGDTMEMLRAVLDTNLWLSTHVVVITIGYSSMFVAGLLAVIYIARGFFTRSLSPETARALSRMVYGIICFATLTSFTGTILGGIWADQSWGRFWGWDPKENGALLIVLWNAIILHARWGGLIKERGLMAMAVFGNIVTSFSWFGVNMLGVGLHSYGFMDKAFFWLMVFDASQAALILLAFLPSRFWASFKSGAPSPAPVLIAVARQASNGNV
ncbi:MAG: cytochrome c biogenesis protein CcsA [Verrucomicrobiota bacterium]|jgi:ABC-type transport system involved in cytochrome c biogenesis permease subunit